MERNINKYTDNYLVYSFDYMRKNTKVAHINYYSRGKVEMQRFTDCIFDNPLPMGVDRFKLYEFFEDRCFPRTRANADELLSFLGLTEYNPIEIIKKTHGLQFDDFYWVKFDGEDINWDDIKLRD